MDKEKSVCAIVVTYNRERLLGECLNALLKQTHTLDAIYIVDNASSDGTVASLSEKGYIRKATMSEGRSTEEIVEVKSMENPDKNISVYHLRMPENTGGSGGFYEGLKRSHEKGYNWLWIMDDDAQPAPDCLENLLKDLQTLNVKISAIVPTRVGTDGIIQTLHAGYFNMRSLTFDSLNKDAYRIGPSLIRIDYCAFVGLLISSEAVGKIGYPRKDFFIYGDDVEYCHRLLKFGNIFLDKRSVIVHKDFLLNEGKAGKFLWFSSTAPRIKISDFWRMYYIVRNPIYLFRKMDIGRIRFYRCLIRDMAKVVGGILLYDDYKTVRVGLVCRAFFDGLKGRFGKIIDPAVWQKQY